LTGWIAASQLDAITLTRGGRFGCVPGFHRRGDRSIQLLIIATAACFRRTPSFIAVKVASQRLDICACGQLFGL